MDVGRGIYKILTKSKAISTMVSTRITPNVMTQRSEFPFIVYDVTNDIPEGQKDSVAKLDIATVMVSGYTDNYKDSNILANYIRTALDRVSGNYNGVNIQAIDFESYDDIFDDASGSDGIYRKALNFNVRILNDINNIYSTDFDGEDDYVAIDGAASVIDADEGSISLWAITDTTEENRYYFAAFGDSNNNISLLFHADTNEVRLSYKGSGSTISAVYTPVIEGDGLWHHIVGTWSQGEDEIKLYVDGDLIDTTASLGVFDGAVAAASIGNDADAGGYFLGNIDEVSLWDSALTAANVTTYYNDGFPSALEAQTGLIGWWRMGDGATYPTIPDDSTNSNAGTMTNMVAADIVPDVP